MELKRHQRKDRGPWMGSLPTPATFASKVINPSRVNVRTDFGLLSSIWWLESCLDRAEGLRKRATWILQRGDTKGRSQDLWWCPACYVQPGLYLPPKKGTCPPHSEPKVTIENEGPDEKTGNWRQAIFQLEMGQPVQITLGWAKQGDASGQPDGLPQTRFWHSRYVSPHFRDRGVRTRPPPWSNEPSACLPWIPQPVQEGPQPGLGGCLPEPSLRLVTVLIQNDSCLKSRWFTWGISSDFNNPSKDEDILGRTHPPLDAVHELSINLPPFLSLPVRVLFYETAVNLGELAMEVSVREIVLTIQSCLV